MYLGMVIGPTASSDLEHPLYGGTWETKVRTLVFQKGKPRLREEGLLMLCGPERVGPRSCGGCFMMASLDSCWMQNGRSSPSLSLSPGDKHGGS